MPVGPGEIIATVHVNCGHASAQQLKRVSSDSDAANMHLLTYVVEVFEQREVRRPFDEAPHVPLAGTPAAAMFNKKLQKDPPSFGDIIAERRKIIALRPTAAHSKYSVLILVRSKHPRVVRDACRTSRIGVFGQPPSIQIDEGSE